MQLTKAVTALLKKTSDMLAYESNPAFKELIAELKEMRGRLDKPLRVAVVGVMKAGKSTLMNAILKEKILFTGTLECTYTVSWFKYGETPRLNIVFKDKKDGTKRDDQSAQFEELEKWTVRPKDTEKHIIDDVAYVEIYYPNEILKIMELIDTPGLKSTHVTDSQNTQDFLGQRLEEEADEISSERTSTADAVIYAFSGSLDAKDAQVLQAFQESTGNASPINAIGVFTKTDLYWDCISDPDANPLEIVAGARERYETLTKDKLYTVISVVAKPVEMVCGLDEKTFDILDRLSKLGTAVLLDYLFDAKYFVTEPADDCMTVSPEDRAHVNTLFGRYGIYIVTKAIQNGITREELPEYLYERSGVNDASELILRHFGNRSYLIKVETMLRRIRLKVSTIRIENHTDGDIVKTCDLILEEIEKIHENEHSFEELGVLQAYYKGEFVISEPEMAEQFFQITGEYGSHCEARLGFDGATDMRVMRKEARLRTQRWNGIANDYGSSRPLQQAAEVIARSCRNLYLLLDELSGFDD